MSQRAEDDRVLIWSVSHRGELPGFGSLVMKLSQRRLFNEEEVRRETALGSVPLLCVQTWSPAETDPVRHK